MHLVMFLISVLLIKNLFSEQRFHVITSNSNRFQIFWDEVIKGYGH